MASPHGLRSRRAIVMCRSIWAQGRRPRDVSCTRERYPVWMRAVPIELTGTYPAIGSRLRASRSKQQMTIEDVARASGLTKGFISRVERDIVSPSVASLLVLCDVLSLEVGSLFAAPDTFFVRAGTGLRMNLGGVGSEERLLTPRREARVQVIRSKIDPSGHGGEELYSLAAEIDVLHVLSGSVTVRFASEDVQVDPGDTFTFDGREPHSWQVTSESGAELLWILAPALWS